MNVPLITWICIVAVFILALVLRMRSTGCGHSRRQPSIHHHRIIEVGNEWEEIYVPGDKRISDDYDYDDYDD